MPMMRIEAEQLAGNKFHLEYEVGGMLSKRVVINASSFDDMISALIEAHNKYSVNAPPEPPRPPVESIAPEPRPEPALPRPRGRKEIAKMRQRVDDMADDRDPGLAERRAAQRGYRG